MRFIYILLRWLWPFVRISEYEEAVQNEINAWDHIRTLDKTVLAEKAKTEKALKWYQGALDENEKLLAAIEFSKLPYHSRVEDDTLLRVRHDDQYVKDICFKLIKTERRRITCTMEFCISDAESEEGRKHMENVLLAYFKCQFRGWSKDFMTKVY